MQECIFYNNSNALPLFLKVYLAQRKKMKKSVIIYSISCCLKSVVLSFLDHKGLLVCDHCFKHQKECRSKYKFFFHIQLLKP